jgi:hypothetical protein
VDKNKYSFDLDDGIRTDFWQTFTHEGLDNQISFSQENELAYPRIDIYPIHQGEFRHGTQVKNVQLVGDCKSYHRGMKKKSFRLEVVRTTVCISEVTIYADNIRMAKKIARNNARSHKYSKPLSYKYDVVSADMDNAKCINVKE